MAVVCSSPAPYTSSIKKKKNKALQAIHPKGNSYLGQLVPIFVNSYLIQTIQLVTFVLFCHNCQILERHQPQVSIFINTFAASYISAAENLRKKCLDNLSGNIKIKIKIVSMSLTYKLTILHLFLYIGYGFSLGRYKLTKTGTSWPQWVGVYHGTIWPACRKRLLIIEFNCHTNLKDNTMYYKQSDCQDILNSYS